MFYALLLSSVNSLGQKSVSITIDDVPNTRSFQLNNYQSPLLEKLDSLNIPIAIFVNEGLIYKTDSISQNKSLLAEWISKHYITVGNHTYSHSRYSEVGYTSFLHDIVKGDSLTREIVEEYDKDLSYFRFPYNDLGKDSIQHVLMDSTLKANHYLSTPFTIESSDWMFNYIYTHYLNEGKVEKAKEIGAIYVSKTMAYFNFFDSLAVTLYERPIRQIYLCHDNPLNADFLPLIIEKLKEENYVFISLDKALEQSVYQQDDNYYKKWGVSWFYRWMPTQKERFKWMKQEPSLETIEQLYNSLRS